jgi:flagellar assembly protein FliH
MQEKSSLHVVEEMTSLSRIIRAYDTVKQEEKQVEIQVRNLFTTDFDEPNEDKKQEPTLTMEDVRAQRDQILSDAASQIEMRKSEFEQYQKEQLEKLEKLKRSWEEEKLVLEQNAYDQGFQQGYEEGMKKALADMQESITVANKVIEDSRQTALSYIEEQEQVILDIALTAAKRIIDVSLDRDDGVFLSIVKRGLKEAREMKEIKIYVSLKYHHILSEQRSELVEMLRADVPLLIFVDEDLKDTEAFIETNHGRIVLSIDEQLSELRIKLNEILDSKE